MKKPKRTRVIRSIGAPDVPLKVWDREILERNDYEFSRLEEFSTEMLNAGWRYELGRELGSGDPQFLLAWEIHETKLATKKLEAHFDGTSPLSDGELRILLPEDPPKTIHQREVDLKRLRAHIRAIRGKRGGKLLSAEELEQISPSWKPPVPKEPMPMLRVIWFNELRDEIPKRYRWLNEGYYKTIQPLEIDWTLSETQLVEAFRNWLRHGQTPYRPGHKRIPKVGKRKTAGVMAWLRELAIYRISEAGFTRPEGLKMLGGVTISAANWEHAQTRTVDRIVKQYDSLRSVALNLSKLDSRESPFWMDHFCDPFDL